MTNIIQDLLKLEKLQEELEERFGVKPAFVQWAAAAGVDQKTLRRRINYGTLCKDKMIKSNIRLVISIAKNYQGAGMNIQDLVQVSFFVKKMNQVFQWAKENMNSVGYFGCDVGVTESCPLTHRKDAEAL